MSSVESGGMVMEGAYPGTRPMLEAACDESRCSVSAVLECQCGPSDGGNDVGCLQQRSTVQRHVRRRADIPTRADHHHTLPLCFLLSMLRAIVPQ